MAHQILIRDNLDDRREIHSLLGRLPPLVRVRFDAWCCANALAAPGATDYRPEVMAKTWDLAERARWDSSADDRLTYEIWLDLWTLAAQYAFSLDSALKKLVAVVRREPGWDRDLPRRPACIPAPASPGGGRPALVSAHSIP